MPQSYSALYYHLVFRTKNRHVRIPDEIRDRLYAYIGGILRSDGGSLIAAGGMPDHLHLLIALGREITISDAVQHIKSRSSAWMHEQGHVKFKWQSGYAIFSVSVSVLPTVENYIANQEEHHRKRSYLEELFALFDRHGIPYDRKYVTEEDHD